MRVVRWFGLILIAFGAVTGALTYYMRQVVVSTDPLSATAFTVSIVICVLVFLVGFVAFLGSPLQPKQRSAGKARRKRRRKLPWNPPREHTDL
jgi:hypothetical protein